MYVRTDVYAHMWACQKFCVCVCVCVCLGVRVCVGGSTRRKYIINRFNASLISARCG